MFKFVLFLFLFFRLTFLSLFVMHMKDHFGSIHSNEQNSLKIENIIFGFNAHRNELIHCPPSERYVSWFCPSFGGGCIKIVEVAGRALFLGIRPSSYFGFGPNKAPNAECLWSDFTEPDTPSFCNWVGQKARGLEAQQLPSKSQGGVFCLAPILACFFCQRYPCMFLLVPKGKK